MKDTRRESAAEAKRRRRNDEKKAHDERNEIKNNQRVYKTMYDDGDGAVKKSLDGYHLSVKRDEEEKKKKLLIESTSNSCHYFWFEKLLNLYVVGFSLSGSFFFCSYPSTFSHAIALNGRIFVSGFMVRSNYFRCETNAEY